MDSRMTQEERQQLINAAYDDGADGRYAMWIDEWKNVDHKFYVELVESYHVGVRERYEAEDW